MSVVVRRSPEASLQAHSRPRALHAGVVVLPGPADTSGCAVSDERRAQACRAIATVLVDYAPELANLLTQEQASR
jgi:hypothetical protein